MKICKNMWQLKIIQRSPLMQVFLRVGAANAKPFNRICKLKSDCCNEPMPCKNLQPDTFYTKHLLHHTPFTKTFFNKKHLYTKPIFLCFCVFLFSCLCFYVCVFVLICLCLLVCDCVGVFVSVGLCFCVVVFLFCVFVFVFVSVFCVCVCDFEYIAQSHCWNAERTVHTTFYHSWNAPYKAGSHLGDAKHNATRTFAQPLNCRTQSEQDIESQLKHPVQCAGQLRGLKSACRHSFNAIDTPNSSIKEPKRCAFKNLHVCVSLQWPAQKMYESCVLPEFGAIDPPNPVRRFTQ